MYIFVLAFVAGAIGWFLSPEPEDLFIRSCVAGGAFSIVLMILLIWVPHGLPFFGRPKPGGSSQESTGRSDAP